MDASNSGQNGQGMPFSYQPNPETRVNDFYLSQVDPFSFVQPLPSSTVLASEPDAVSQPAPRSDYDETQEPGDSAYGTNSGGKQWQLASQSIYGGTVSSMSTVGALAARMSGLHVPYAQSEAGVSPRQPGGRPKRRRLSRPVTATALSSTAGPGTVNDAHSIGAVSEHGEDMLARYAVEYADGYMECTLCGMIKKPRCDMIKHINTHVKPYKCSSSTCKQYTRGFATKSDLERHEQTHTDTKNLPQAYVCKHDKCRAKDKLWKRWDNLKTHLRDVHRIEDAPKEEYRKKHDATRDQDLAGMGLDHFRGVAAAAPPIVPGSILEDFNSDIMVMGDLNAAFRYPPPQDNTQHFIDKVEQIVNKSAQRHTAPGVEMPHLGNANTAATAPATHYATHNSLFNNQEQMGIYAAYSTGLHQHQGPYFTGTFGMLPGTPNAMFQQQPDLPQQQGGLSYQSMSFQQPLQSMTSPLSSFQTSQTTRSLASNSQVLLSSPAGQHPASFSRHAVQPQPPPSVSSSTWMTAGSVFVPDSHAQDAEMRDAGVVETGSVQSANRVQEMDADIDMDADVDVDVADDDDGVAETNANNSNDDAELKTGEQDADGSMQSKSVEGAGGGDCGSGIINISDDDEPPAVQNETASQPKSPTSHRVSFAEPPSAAIDEPLHDEGDEDEDEDENEKDGDEEEEEIELGVPNETISQPVQRPGATPTVGIDQLLDHFGNYSPQDIRRFLDGINNMEALKNSGYEIRAPAQSSTHSRSVRSAQTAQTAQTGPSEGGDGGKMHRCLADGCSASFPSSSGLKKHETRHKRPFGCTHGCKAHDKPQTFGSKNDWKRHEESFHFSQDLPAKTWQCDEMTVDQTVCGRVFGRAALLQRHLTEQHGVRDKAKKVLERAAKYRLIPASEASYWCGFCRETLTDRVDAPSAASAVSTTSSSRASSAPTIAYARFLTYRFNHIDNHFAGRNCPRTSIDEWVTKEQHQARAEARRLAARRAQSDSHDKSRSADALMICCRCSNMSARINSESCNDCGVRFCGNCKLFEGSPEC